jgi:hypothetical protein
MTTELLFKASNVEIHYNQEEKFLHANWKGFQSVDLIKNGCEKLLELMKAKKCYSILNDNTLVSGTWHGAAEWGALDWFPRMNQAGLKHFAWVYSPSVFSQLSTDKMISTAKDEKIKTFGNPLEAQKWLNSQRN